MTDSITTLVLPVCPHMFFSENHFTIRDSHAKLPFENLRHHNTSPIATDYPYGRLAVSKFLRDVVPTHCLTILRFLELLLPIHVTPKYLDRDALEREWRATLDWAREKTNPLVLTIRCVILCPYPSIDSTGLGHDILALTEEEETRVLKSHARILSPLESFTRDVGPVSFDVQIAHYTYPRPDRQRCLLQQFKKIGQFPVGTGGSRTMLISDILATKLTRETAPGSVGFCCLNTTRDTITELVPCLV